MSIFGSLPVVTSPMVPRGMIYVVDVVKHSGGRAYAQQSVCVHPLDLAGFMEQRWPEAIESATEEVARSLWLQMGRRERDRCSLELARAGARRREWRAR